MAKKKKPSKRRKINKRSPAVSGPKQYEFHRYDEWRPNMPDWLKKIRVLTDNGDIIQAQKLLVEEEIQEKLANINDNDTRSKFFVRCEVAMLLDSTGQVERALRYYSETLKIVNCAGVYNKMGLLYANCGQNIQAIANFQKAEQLEPDGIYIWINLARCFMKIGRIEETLRLLRKAISADPQSRGAYPNFLYCLNYLIDTKASEIFQESKKWAQIQAPTTLAFTNHDNCLDPHRKLRIGYISPDFRKHSVTYYFEPILNGHDRNKFDIYAYGDIETPDKVTGRLVEKFDFYRNIKGVGDKEVAELIRSDSIDILVDLAGHTGRNRLHVLAYKPAPIQVNYLGYPNTTGMPQVDYRLTDAIADTPDQQQYYTEKLVFLPNGFLCYDPGQAQLPVKALPMTYNKYVTFGCFNNVNKLNPFMIKIWADLLDAVPNSKMIIKFREGEDLQIREYYYNLFTEHGLENAHERVTFFGWLTNAQHLELYNNIDIALDTYPYNGTTTTCEALLMGVPVITLVGSRHASRVGLDILSRLDLPSFAAQSPEEYVKKAIALAVEPDALTQIRATIRQRLAASPLCNYKLITNDIENAYRQMWQDYCCSKEIEIKEIKSQDEVDFKPQEYSDLAVIDLIAGDDKFHPAGQRTKTIKRAAEAPCKSSSDKPKQRLSIDSWQQPGWLKEANSFVSQGKPEKAAQLLTEESLEKHIAAASQHEKEFIRYIAAGLLRQIKQPQRAEILYKESLISMPNNLAIYNDLALLCQSQGRINEAVEYLATAIRINPDEPRLWGNLASHLMQLGQTEKATAILRKTVQKMPGKNSVYSNLLLSMHYVPDVDRKGIFEESKRWAKSNAPVHLARTRHKNDPDPHRRLRIGYISPDFREHSVTFFFEPLLDGHNREDVQVYGYGSVAVPDEATSRLRGKFDIYRDIKTLTDKEAANLIENDEIDILVDLAGHTGNTRVYVLAHKPAPIQLTWLGYPDTTGMSQVDYRITDSIADPPGSEKFYTEQLYNLPDGFLCYGPGERMPPMAPLPAIEKGHIAFGAFNESGKINPVIIDLWSKILKATKDSTLLLKFKAGRDDEFRQVCLQQFEKSGISPERITIRGWLSLPDHLKLYNRVDISLDTYPYNGTTTTCQALLMGVPVISLTGEHHMSRVGLSILTRLGLEFFAASTPDEYVSKATALAAKPDALAKIRAQLRARMAAGTLCNRELFTNNIEQAYRTMWHKWCKTQGVDVSSAELKQDAPHIYTDANACCAQSRPAATAQAEKTDTARKLHIGGKQSHPGWEIFNIQKGPNVDHVGDACDLSRFTDQTFDELYASHTLEHFDYNGPLQKTLKEWHRVLKPNGKLYLSVPDMDVLCRLFTMREKFTVQERFHLIRIMFGGHTDQYDYHYVGFCSDVLNSFLAEAGFQKGQKVRYFGIFEDASTLCIGDIPISLNVIAFKSCSQHLSRGMEVPSEKFRTDDKHSGADAAEHSPVTQEQKTSLAVQDAAPQPNSPQLSRIAELVVMAERLRRTGHRTRAAECVLEGWNRLFGGEKAGDIPQQILLNWNAREEKALFVHLCISLIAYSSYFNPSAYRQLFKNWVELESFNPEPHLRLGLLSAMEAMQTGKAVPSDAMEALRHANRTMQDERSAAALALAQHKLTELALPYDEGRIYVYPDLCNVTTYVLLEQRDWFEHDDLALFRTLIRPDDKVLDLGANVGIYAISAALRTGSQGCVVAVEPARETFELLNRSASAFEHMTAVQAAVSDKSGTGSLLPGRTPEANKLGGAGRQRGEKVEVLSIDDLAESTGIDCFDIIKMDVEDHGQQTLAGAQKIIGENSPIIFYEIKEEDGDLHTELVDVFQKLGYDSYYYVGGTSTLVRFRKGMELDEFLLNMVAVRPQSLQRFEGLVNIADVLSEELRPDAQRLNTDAAAGSSKSTQITANLLGKT